MVTCDEEIPRLASIYKTLGVFLPAGVHRVKKILRHSLPKPSVTFDNRTIFICIWKYNCARC